MELILNNKYYWNNLYYDCKEYIKNCHICAQSKNSNFKIPKITSLKANYPNEIIHMDLTDIPKEYTNNCKDLEKENSNFKLAVIVDNLSKYAFIEIISNKAAINVLPVLMKYINTIGIPKILLTDNGTEFVNNIFSDYCKNNNIEHRKTRPYNPRCNGIVERFNKTIKDMLTKEYIKNKNDFNLKLALENCVFVYNHKVHNSTKFKPFDLFNSKNKKEWDIAYNNIEKYNNKNNKKANPLEKKQKVLL